MGAAKSRSYAPYKIHNNQVDSNSEAWQDGPNGSNGCSAMAKPSVKVCKDDDELILLLGYLIEKRANEAIRKLKRFTVGVSGGSLPNYLCRILPNLKTDWSKWVIFFCDERVVPFDDPESTYGVYREKLVGVVPITDEQIIKIDPKLQAKDAALDYAGKIAQYFPEKELPNFDLLLLGLGPDGHTCSLFPDHELLREQGLWVAPITDSPKPPPSRVTLTLPVINNAVTVIFVCTGDSKADVVQKILEDPDCRLPGALVKPTSGELHWILDQGAGKSLTNY